MSKKKTRRNKGSKEEGYHAKANDLGASWNATHCGKEYNRYPVLKINKSKRCLVELSGSLCQQPVNNFNYSLGVIVSGPHLARLGMGVDDFIPKVGRDAVISDDCAHEAEHDAAVRISIEPFRKHINCGLNELLLQIFVGVFYFQDLIDRVYEWQFNILRCACCHDWLVVVFNASPHFQHLLRAEVTDVLPCLMEGQHMVPSLEDAAQHVGIDEGCFAHQGVGSNQPHFL